MRGSEALREVEPTQQANRSEPERFVDSVVAAKSLSIQRRQLLELARTGRIPACPLGDGQRRVSVVRSCEGDGAAKNYCKT